MWIPSKNWQIGGYSVAESIVMEKRSLAWGVLYGLLERRDLLKSRRLHRILGVDRQTARAVRRAQLDILTSPALIKMTAAAIHHHLGVQNGTQKD